MPSRQLKANKIRVLRYFPTVNYGVDGDIILAKIQGKGTYLCAKAEGVWYTHSPMAQLNKVGSSYIKKLKVDELKFRKLQNLENGSDKFVVGSSKNKLKYRTIISKRRLCI